MVGNVQRLHGPRYGVPVPLAERWTAAVDTLARLAPGEAAPAPITEINLDAMNARISELRRAKEPPPMDAATCSAAQEFYGFRRQYNSIAVEVRGARGWLQRARSDWRHLLLHDLSPDCFTELQPVSLFPDDTPDFRSVLQARDAARDFLGRLQFARGIQEEIRNAKSFDSLGADQQAVQLCKALFNNQITIQNRLEGIEAALSAIEARADRLERRNKQSNAKRSKHLERAA
jgi:hypothetical protein